MCSHPMGKIKLNKRCKGTFPDESVKGWGGWRVEWKTHKCGMKCVKKKGEKGRSRLWCQMEQADGWRMRSQSTPWWGVGGDPQRLNPEKSLELKHTPAWPEISPTVRVISWPQCFCFFFLTHLLSWREDVHLQNFQHRGAVATRLIAELCRVSLINITGSTVWAVYLAVFMLDRWKMWFTAAVWCASQNLTCPLIFLPQTAVFFFPLWLRQSSWALYWMNGKICVFATAADLVWMQSYSDTTLTWEGQLHLQRS